MNNQPFHLVAHVLCPYVQRSIILLKEKNITYNRTDIDLGNKPEWFKRISPLGKVPVLTINEDRSLFESTVICEYINEVTPNSLHPQDPLEKAYHRSWIEFGSGILNNISGLYNAQNKDEFDAKRLEIKTKFQQIEQEIMGSSYFSGEEFHLIDAVYGPIYRYFDIFDLILDLEIFDALPKVSVWKEALQKRHSIQQAVSIEYPRLLLNFLINRHSYISDLILNSQTILNTEGEVI
ncbi:MAG: glutathione S-transferase [Methylophaga sp.]|nr:MAG: glutathione S-transferase [Methylophaga sp.]